MWHGVRSVLVWLVIMLCYCLLNHSEMNAGQGGDVDQFVQFRVASELSKETQVKQVSIYCFIVWVRKQTMYWSIQTLLKKVGDVLTKFDAHFKVHKNMIFERAQFNRRTQEDDEWVDKVIMSLYSLAENCEFGLQRKNRPTAKIGPAGPIFTAKTSPLANFGPLSENVNSKQFKVAIGS